MSIGFPDPQLMADAQNLNVFASAVSQAAIQLINFPDKASPEYEKLKAYYKENMPKLKVFIEHLEADLG
jgi:hypothetical protein